ncbi:uncharacterized protein LOC125194871 [Salvia hispanica]|uniref:uncharacterized protein LOC125194871 n=1 Tax=Salvia hispanica TaxID=49212 RepID=UPI0020095BBA|nr:uncharacterized protein LOC125194871 [Salvia hispanica]
MDLSHGNVGSYPRVPIDETRVRDKLGLFKWGPGDQEILYDLIIRGVELGGGEEWYRCFTLRHDATGRPGLSTYQKCTVAIRQLAYAGPADMFDEYLQMGKTTALKTLRQFCKGIKAIFKGDYLRKPMTDECQRLINMLGTVHHFPGMLGSIDCMHWEWRNCPVAWKGQFTSGFKGRHPTMILEAVAVYRLQIWHAYLGVVGSNNDINILKSSHLFNDESQGEGPQVSFVANGT